MCVVRVWNDYFFIVWPDAYEGLVSVCVLRLAAYVYTVYVGVTWLIGILWHDSSTFTWSSCLVSSCVFWLAVYGVGVTLLILCCVIWLIQIHMRLVPSEFVCAVTRCVWCGCDVTFFLIVWHDSFISHEVLASWVRVWCDSFCMMCVCYDLFCIVWHDSFAWGSWLVWLLIMSDLPYY